MCIRDRDMTDYESTLLAGIPNAPSCYAPTVSQELAARRQPVSYTHLFQKLECTGNKLSDIMFIAVFDKHIREYTACEGDLFSGKFWKGVQLSLIHI